MGRRGLPGSGNYPPGAENDPRAPYNQPDRSHEHRWQHAEEPLQPIIEDGAAIFTEECLYAEGEYGDGWRCEETRTYRFEYSRLESPGGNEWDIPPMSEWDGEAAADDKIAQKVVTIEERFHQFGPGDEVSLDVDPDPDCGQVSIEYKDWTLVFEP